MPECHKCEWNGKRSKRCLTCRGPSETNRKGRTHVSIEAGAGGQTYGEVLASTRQPSDVTERHPDLQAVADFMATMFECDRKTFAIIRYRFQHPRGSLRVVARRYGVSMQSVHQRLQRAARVWPGVCVLLNLKLARNPACGVRR